MAALSRVPAALTHGPSFSAATSAARRGHGRILVLAYLNTEAVKRKTRHIELDHHFSHFCAALGIPPTTRPRGSLPQLREPMQRLFASTFQCVFHDEEKGRHWDSLQLQFGYGDKNPRHFKRRFLKYLRNVISYYPEVRLTNAAAGLLLKPSPTHVASRSSPMKL